jgi:hypothetical protein
MGCTGSKAAETSKVEAPQTIPATLLEEGIKEPIASKDGKPNEGTAEGLDLPGTQSKSKFFAVYHTFKSADASAAFWKFMMDSKPEEVAKMNADWDAMGFHNHLFLPDGGDKPTLCIWETKEPMTVGDFQAFVDSEKGPGGGKTFDNRVTHVAPDAAMPTSFFESPVEAVLPAPSTGAFFWVDHTFKSEDASKAFWKFVAESTPEDTAKMNADWDSMGFHNHFFLPEGGSGQTICIWESQRDMTTADFKAFMDSEKGPGGGATFDNDVHKVASEAVVPSAFFTVQANDARTQWACLKYCATAEAEGEIRSEPVV